MSRSEAIRRLADRAGGVRADEVSVCTPKQANAVISKLVATGVLCKVVINRKHVRYFSREFDRDAWMKQWKTEHSAHPRPPERVPDRGRAAWLPGTVAVIPPGVVPQVIPCGFQPRYQGHVGNVGAMGLQRGRV